MVACWAASAGCLGPMVASWCASTCPDLTSINSDIGETYFIIIVPLFSFGSDIGETH